VIGKAVIGLAESAGSYWRTAEFTTKWLTTKNWHQHCYYSSIKN